MTLTSAAAVRRITVVNPNLSEPMTVAITAAARRVAPAGVELTGVHPTTGVTSVESHAEEAIAAVGVLEVVRTWDERTDAFVIACFGDTGVAAAREVATGPVVGMTEAALQTACLVAHRFAVITMPPRTIAHTDRVVAALGLGHRCGVSAVEVAVGELDAGAAELLPLFLAEGRRSIAAGAEALVLGCAGLAELVEPLTEELGVPVIDGVAAAVGLAAGLLAQGLRTSRVATYAPVPDLVLPDLVLPDLVLPDLVLPSRADGQG